MYKVYVKYTESERAAFIKKHEAEWKRVGAEIYDLRTQLHISQKRLAEEAGICDNTLRKLERGQYIARFKTVVSSCRNALSTIAYGIIFRIQINSQKN